ncbi:unnamed protein product [Taenia asiatica]|uniref:PLAT domain-containing protein n=1 Tax=Taenia asiatica TaxID=60517 RepID=A0A0R3WES7_TAEAS|nr:unnamed protein product [Taenia asiatica]
MIGFEIGEEDVSFSFQIKPDDPSTKAQYLVFARFVNPPHPSKVEKNWGLIWSLVLPSLAACGVSSSGRFKSVPIKLQGYNENDLLLDNESLAALGITPLAENNPADEYLYEVIVRAGMRRGGGTTSTLCIQVNGEKGGTASFTLRDLPR